MDEKLLHCFFWRSVVSRRKQRRSEHHQTSTLADASVPEKPIQTVTIYRSKETSSARPPQLPLSDTLSSDDAPCVPQKNFTVFQMLCSDNHPTCFRKHNWESGGEKKRSRILSSPREATTPSVPFTTHSGTSSTVSRRSSFSSLFSTSLSTDPNIHKPDGTRHHCKGLGKPETFTSLSTCASVFLKTDSRSKKDSTVLFHVGTDTDEEFGWDVRRQLRQTYTGLLDQSNTEYSTSGDEMTTNVELIDKELCLHCGKTTCRHKPISVLSLCYAFLPSLCGTMWFETCRNHRETFAQDVYAKTLMRRSRPSCVTKLSNAKNFRQTTATRVTPFFCDHKTSSTKQRPYVPRLVFPWKQHGADIPFASSPTRSMH